MENFIYHTPTKVYFGKKQEEKIGLILAELHAQKVLIHYGKKSIIQSGLLSTIKRQIQAQNILIFELGGVEPNPKLSLVEKGVKMVQENHIDFVLAIGGGSVIDSAKLICAGACVTHSPWLFSVGQKSPLKTIPLGVILTISASGSDMSNSCVITNEKTKEKRGFTSELNRPKFAILNPELTYTVSPYQTACGIVDIMMHTLERFISNTPETNLTDELAIGLLKAVYKVGEIAIKDPTNYEARATLLWANSLSHNGLTSCGRTYVMSVHQLEHELSGMFDEIAHGAGLAILWPAWAKYAYPSAKERFLKISYEFLNIEPSHSIENDILLGIEKLKSYFQSIGMPTTLHEVNVTKKDIQQLAINVTFQHQRVIHDVIEIDEEMAYKIYFEAL